MNMPAGMLAATLALVATNRALAADEAHDKLTAKAEACISAGAADAERTNPSLTDAADFLLTFLCAQDVEKREAFDRGTDTLAGLRKAAATPVDQDDEGGPLTPAAKKKAEALQERLRAAYEKAYVDPDSGDIVYPDDLPKNGTNILEINYSVGRFPQAFGVPGDLRVYAGRAVLQARIARLKAEGK